MIDAHCHILWGVDDGSDNREMSAAMLQRAKEAGITRIHCTPHLRWDDFDLDKVQARYREFKEMASTEGLQTTLGFEVYYKTLMRKGLGIAQDFVLQGTDCILLEFNSGAHVPSDFLCTVYKLQSEYGLEVTLAHPERYQDCWSNFDLVREWKGQGVQVQVSAMDLFGGPFNKVASCAKRIVKEGLCDQLVSDAHRPEDYAQFVKACRKYR